MDWSLVHPPSITNTTRCNAVGSRVGSPSTAIRSACIPVPIVPTSLPTPSAVAVSEVADVVTSSGRWSACCTRQTRSSAFFPRSARSCSTSGVANMSAAIDHPRGSDGDEGRLRWERRGDDRPSEESEQTSPHGDETARPYTAAQLGAREAPIHRCRPTRYAFSTTFSQLSTLFRNISYPFAASASGIVCEITKLGSMSPF